MLQLQFIPAPDDGREHHLKLVEQFAGNNRLYKVAYCLIILAFIDDAWTHEHKVNDSYFDIVSTMMYRNCNNLKFTA